MNSVILFLQKAKRKRGKGNEMQKVLFFIFRERERERLLSKISANPTVGFLRSKKESCSTRRGQRVGTGLREFRQTP